MRCVICNSEMKPVKEYGEHPRGKFKGEKTLVLRCETDKHRVTVYLVERRDAAGDDATFREIEVRPGRRSRAAELLERAEALA